MPVTALAGADARLRDRCVALRLGLAALSPPLRRTGGRALTMGTINVTGIGKAYKQYPTRWSRLAGWVLPFGGARHVPKWVLQDITFSVQPGRALGIIG